MIGGIIAIVIAYWFYRTAESGQLPALQWAVGGTVVFYVPNFLWSLLVAKPMLNQMHAQNATAMATMVGFSSVLVGAAVAIAVHFLILRKLIQRSRPS